MNEAYAVLLTTVPHPRLPNVFESYGLVSMAPLTFFFVQFSEVTIVVSPSMTANFAWT